MSLRDKAARLRALHHEDRPLLLPNVWDVVSARVVAAAGFPAIATASHAVAESLGHEDHEGAPHEEMFATAARITRSVDVPVSVDAEAGYGLPPADLAALLREAGAAGCNLEDTLHEPGGPRFADLGEQADRIAGLRGADRDLVINARIDVYVGDAMSEASDEERLEEAVRRALAYVEAGADAVYPILVADEKAISALVTRVPAPVNILYRPGAPSLERLGELGVGRVTFGPGLHRATMARLSKLAETLRTGVAPY